MSLLAAASLGAQTRLIVISGLGGEPRYTQAFTKWGAALADAGHARFGLADSNITWLGEDSVAKSPLYTGRATRDNIQRALAAVARGAGASEQIVIVLIGHGSGEGEDTRISLPGPDVTAADFARMLAQFPTQRVAFINLTSASGDVMKVLAAPRRVVVTATKSAFERNESQFARHFVAALTVGGADVDKDGRISMLEAFRYAATETKRFYETENRLPTEHAQLDDDGDGTGSSNPDGRTGDGVAARRFFLDATVTGARAATSDPRLAALYRDQDTRRDQIDALRKREREMTPAAYEAELEKVLSAFADAAREIRKLEGRP
jgi:hypothetical protein